MVEKSGKIVDFKASLAEKADIASTELEKVLAGQKNIQPDLKTAMAYALNAPGKRFRAAIALWGCEIISGTINDAAKLAAVAIEMVHTYSLVHDDLPAMDDDDFRRGLPSCHKAFDEATAILVGDALLTLAFEILAAGIEDKGMAVKMIATVADAAGPSGMIAGQMADMQSHQAKGTVELLEYIHTNKTARMFAAAAAMGAIAASANDEQLKQMKQYGLNIGLGFQIADDILDVTASTEHLGKTAGKDAQQGKLTYPVVVGIDDAKKLANDYTERAIESLHIFGDQADILRQLANELLNRTK
jgi:geranylgeranyl diphosphate synthase type II